MKNDTSAPLQWRLFFIVLVLGVTGIAYTLLGKSNLDNTAAVYIGLPLLLALGLSLTPKTKSALGATMKGMTIALFLSAVIFREGYICILFASPIFYAVGAMIAYPIDCARQRKNKKITLQTAVISMIAGLLSLEGTTNMTTIARNNNIVVSKVISATVDEVRNEISKTPKFGKNKPIFLRIFPYPAEISGSGLEVGDERKVKFVAYKHIWWTKVEGHLVLRVSESTPNSLTFDVEKDESYLSHYLKWQSSKVFFEAVDDHHTKVTWTLSYQRRLDPEWYFGPMQNYAVARAAGELIDHVATPGT